MNGLPRCCCDFEIEPMLLLFPDRLDEAGREYMQSIGVNSITLETLRRGAVDMGNGKVRIQHRCAMLHNDGRCLIYPDRPRICQDFDCATRTDCVCGGKGLYHG